MKTKCIGGFASTLLALALIATTVLSIPAFGVSTIDKTKLYLRTPPVQIGEIAAGDSYTGTFTMAEQTDIPAYIKLYTSPYSMKEGEYTPIYEGPESYRNSIKDWITFPEGTEYTIPPGEEIHIPYIINIPKNALGGSQYCAIIAENITPTTDSDEDDIIHTVAVGRVALPIFADILGDGMRLSGEIINWNVNSIFLSPPLKGDFTIKNTGNVIFSVNYKFEVFDFFRGDDSVYTEEDDKSVFPDTQRTINHAWEDAPLLGLFRVKEKISFLDTSEDFSKLVLIIPLFLIILILIILTLGITLIVYRHRTRKQEKKRLSKTYDL